MLNVHWIEVIVILGAAQGLFLSLSIQKIVKRSKEVTRILAWLLFSISAMLVGRIVYLRYNPEWPYQLTLIPDVVIFLFGPLLYFFIHRLLYQNDKGSGLRYLHFIPAVVHLGAFFYFLQYSAAVYYTMSAKGELFYYYAITEGAAIILNCGYLIGTIKLVQDYKKAADEEKAQSRLTYLTLIIVSILIAVSGWLLSFVMSTFYGNPSYYDVIWIVIPCITFLIAYCVISEPEILRIAIVRRESAQKLKDEDVEHIKEKLESLMVQEKLYQLPKLRLNQLATKLEISPNQMSWLLNEIYDMSFYDFLNEFRINAFIQKLNRNEHENKTLLALAYEVGFNSKTTFNKSFKKSTTYTPRDYLSKEMRVA